MAIAIIQWALLSPYFLYLGVAFGILEQTQNKLNRLDGPATLGNAKDGSLGSSTNTTAELAEGDSLLVGLDIAQVGNSLLEVHTLDGISGFRGVLFECNGIAKES